MFDDLKALYVNAPVLTYSQVNRPVEQASRAMTPIEVYSCAQLEQELLGVVFAQEIFHSYCYAYPLPLTVEMNR